MTLMKVVRQLPLDQFSVTYVNSRWIEIQTANISKGLALRKVMYLCGVNRDETVACGDGENDIPMLQEVTHAVVMKNAMAKVRKYGKYTAGNCYDEGLAEWIERNLL